MNKSALKSFATKARLELMGMVSTRVDYLLGLGDDLPIALKDDMDNISAIRERCSSDGQIDKDKREGFVEEVAYTWFNRLIALRFMDANAITESRVVSPLDGQTLPEVFNEAKGGTISKDLVLDRDKFYDIIDGKIPSDNPDNEAYKMLFISVCNHYNKLMPFMFESISDYTELLLPDDMLSSNSIRAKVIEAMSEEDTQDIEVIGWLYQFYISEKKDDVFAKLKKNQKITPANIPAATQLFTPHWIVKYMVENSLGKLWMLNNPNSSLKDTMKYYIENEEEATTFIKVTSPEEITFLDPCCGSGHTLTYAFDLLTAIYEEEGYNKSDIPSLILENNLFGCDIDKRASVLANFALTMKARQYHKRFFKKDVKPNIVELEDYGSDEFAGIKNYGSLLTPNESVSFDDGVFGQSSREYELQKRILSDEFHCVVTNPPYMGAKGMNKELSDFVKKKYPNSKFDLMTCFMERSLELTKKDGYSAMINIPSWMFLSSFEKLRIQLLDNNYISSLIHFGRGVFGSDFGTVSYTIQKSINNNLYGIYRELFIKRGNVDNIEQKEKWYLDKSFGFYKAKQEDFSKIPGSPIAYWVNEKIFKIYTNNKINQNYQAKEGIGTRNDERFIRQFWEVGFNNIKLGSKLNEKWLLIDKAGSFQKWVVFEEFVMNWLNDGEEIRNYRNPDGTLKSRPQNLQYIDLPAISWGKVTSGKSSFRFRKENRGFVDAAPSLFGDDLTYILGFLNSKVATLFLELQGALTINTTTSIVGNLPLLLSNNHLEVKQYVEQCKYICDEYILSSENSWGFTKNELII